MEQCKQAAILFVWRTTGICFLAVCANRGLQSLKHTLHSASVACPCTQLLADCLAGAAFEITLQANTVVQQEFVHGVS